MVTSIAGPWGPAACKTGSLDAGGSLAVETASSERAASEAEEVQVGGSRSDDVGSSICVGGTLAVLSASSELRVSEEGSSVDEGTDPNK
mmetsp:Transcript_22167/g.62957  ORF Transcript_22167/g.62957 Transcript_22167/m.62957 type:complete len:89 (+) Transcript_22167:417-683(+)